jgi:hypothetical protein
MGGLRSTSLGAQPSYSAARQIKLGSNPSSLLSQNAKGLVWNYRNWAALAAPLFDHTPSIEKQRLITAALPPKEL